MRLKNLIDDIVDALSFFQISAKNRSKNNLQDINILAETFFAELFNKMFNYTLESANVLGKNEDSIDLIDYSNKIFIQVSITGTIVKVSHTLELFGKKIINEPEFSNYRVMLFLYPPDANVNKTIKKPQNPYVSNGFSFEPQKDIILMSDLISFIKAIPDIKKIEEIRQIILKHTGYQPQGPLFNSSYLSIVIKALANGEEGTSKVWNINVFNLEDKVVHNGMEYLYENFLKNITSSIGQVDNVYEAYIDDGDQTVELIYKRIGRVWRKSRAANPNVSNEVIFDNIISCLSKELQADGLCTIIQYEKLENIIELITYQAFVRCKIFDTPVSQEVNYVYTE